MFDQTASDVDESENGDFKAIFYGVFVGGRENVNVYNSQ